MTTDYPWDGTVAIRVSGAPAGRWELALRVPHWAEQPTLTVNGTDGSLAFDFEENNLLQFFDGTQPVEEQGFRRILVTEPEHPYVGAWWPPGHGLGYEQGFTHQVVDLVAAIADNRQPTPSFDDGLRVQRVLGAVEDSAARDSAWTTV